MGFGEGWLYNDPTPRVEKLFPIDPRLEKTLDAKLQICQEDTISI